MNEAFLPLTKLNTGNYLQVLLAQSLLASHQRIFLGFSFHLWWEVPHNLLPFGFRLPLPQSLLSSFFLPF